MTLLAWILTGSLFVLYIVLLFTVCMLTFQKGYTVWGIIGIFLPFIWLICALLPAKEGSPYQRKKEAWATWMEQMTRRWIRDHLEFLEGAWKSLARTGSRATTGQTLGKVDQVIGRVFRVWCARVPVGIKAPPIDRCWEITRWCYPGAREVSRAVPVLANFSHPLGKMGYRAQ